MAIAYSWSQTGTQQTAVTSFNYTFTGQTVNSGDLLILAAGLRQGCFNNPNVPTPVGWTKVAVTFDAVNEAFAFCLFYKVAGASESGTYASGTLAQPCTATWAFIDYTGVNNSTPVDASSGAQTGASSNTIATPSLTATLNNDVYVGVGLDNGNNGAYTYGSTLTQRVKTTPPGADGFPYYIVIGEKQLAATGATGTFNITSTASPAFWWAGALLLETSAPVAPVLMGTQSIIMM